MSQLGEPSRNAGARARRSPTSRRPRRSAPACSTRSSTSDYDELPAPAYVKGYIQSYAKYLDIPAAAAARAVPGATLRRARDRHVARLGARCPSATVVADCRDQLHAHPARERARAIPRARGSRRSACVVWWHRRLVHAAASSTPPPHRARRRRPETRRARRTPSAAATATVPVRTSTGSRDLAAPGRGIRAHGRGQATAGIVASGQRRRSEGVRVRRRGRPRQRHRCDEHRRRRVRGSASRRSATGTSSRATDGQIADAERGRRRTRSADELSTTQ